MAVAPSASTLTSEAWARREDLVRRFDRAWRQGQRPSIDDFLAHAGSDSGAESHSVLLELVHTDLEYRLKEGEPARVEDYVSRYPELGPDDMLELVLGEWEFRRRREADLTIAEFIDRFPRYRRQLLDVHDSRRPETPAPRAHETKSADIDPERARLGLGRFVIAEEMGRGASGVVYRATDTQLGRTVALKVPRAGWLMSPEDQEQFLREARNVAQLAHPAIVSLFDAGRSEGTCYLVYEFVAGTTLAGRMAKARPLPRESAELVARLAEALHYAHKRGVIHRDIKPSNVLIDGDGRPHLTDFGLARSASAETSVTLSGDVLGTPAYMSPEQARGDSHKVDARTDVYGLGVVLYELLTGEVLFRGTSRMLLRQVLEDEPPPPRRRNEHVPVDLEVICLKCLAKAPDHRYADAQALADDLRRFLDGRPILARPAGRAERLGRWCRRNPGIASLASALAIALVAGLAAVTYLWLTAERQKDLAVLAHKDARQAVEENLTIVSESDLLNVSGMQPLRKRLLEAALAYYQRLLRRRDQPESLADVADAQMRVARITELIGSKEEALASYLEALGHNTKLVASGRPRADDQSRLAQCWAAAGKLQHRLGRLDEALASYENARRIDEVLARDHPSVTEYREELARCAYVIGALRHDTGHPEAAAEEFERARAIREQLVADHPDEADAQAALAESYHGLALLKYKGGDVNGALAHYDRTRRLYAQLAADHPDEAEYQANLASSENDIGGMLYLTGRLDEAIASSERARVALAKLADANPAVVEFQALLAKCQSNLGSIYADKGDRASSLEAGRQARETRARLVAAHPAVTEFQEDLAKSENNLGRSYLGARDTSSAIDAYIRARDLRARLAEANPGNREVRRLLGRSELCLGVALAMRGDTAEALAAYEQASAVLEALLKEGPDDLDSTCELARLMGHRGASLSTLGCHDEAVTDADRGVDALSSAVDQAPHMQLFREYLAEAHLNRAGIRRRMGLIAEAATSALGARAALPDDPDTLYDVARELALCHKPSSSPGDESEGAGAVRTEIARSAIETLGMAIECGFKDLDRLSDDRDLASVRQDAGFAALLMDVKFPDDPFAR
jgi:tetratricopeptide (TPR) repeat protein